MARDRAKDEKIEDEEESGAVAVDTNGEDEPKEKLELDVQVTNPSACERHVTVTIPRDDINRYFDNAYGEMMPNAGFSIRAGPEEDTVLGSACRSI